MATYFDRHFRPDRLPVPKVFYEGEGFRLGRANRKGWAMAQGPIPCHKSTSGKSLSVNLNHGGFVCHGCGSKGSMIGFVMLSYHLSAKESAQHLGAWDEAPSPETVRKFAEQARERDRQQQAEEMEQRDRRQRLTRLRDQLHDAVAHYQQISERLSELCRGASPDWENEQESCWSSLVDTLNDWRDIEVAYCAAAGLESPL